MRRPQPYELRGREDPILGGQFDRTADIEIRLAGGAPPTGLSLGRDASDRVSTDVPRAVSSGWQPS
jgi:hypothetical protein